jgi:hypothetical protein
MPHFGSEGRGRFAVLCPGIRCSHASARMTNLPFCQSRSRIYCAGVMPQPLKTTRKKLDARQRIRS